MVDGWGALRTLSQNSLKWGWRWVMAEIVRGGGLDLEGLSTPAPHELNFNCVRECCECIIMIAE